MNNLVEERDTNGNNDREIISHKNENSNRTNPLQSNLLSQPRTSNSQQDKINQQDQIKDQIKKEKKSYYGHILIFGVLFVIIEQYISYIFIIEISNIKSKNKNKIHFN